jgi:hypothetical protein
VVTHVCYAPRHVATQSLIKNLVWINKPVAYGNIMTRWLDDPSNPTSSPDAFEHRRVVITDVDMTMGAMCRFMVK